MFGRGSGEESGDGAVPDRHHQGTTGTTTHPKPIASERYDDVKGNSIDIDSDGGDNIEEENEDEDDELEEIVPQRKKRIRRVYNGMIECNVEPIRSLLTCTLCEGLYREPYTTLKCFHTFCKSCLITAIRASYNTPQYNCCPVCQTYFGRDDIVTNNALPDRVLETLIDKVLFPHLSHQDYVLECEFYHKRNIQQKDNTATGTATTGAVGDSAVTGSDTSSMHTATTTKQHRDDRNQSPAQRPPPKTVVLSDDRDHMMSFQLVPVRGQPKSLTFPFFQTSGQIRVKQIKKLLAMKLFPDHLVDNPDETRNDLLDIYCNGCLLEDELTLNFISHVIWGADPTKNQKSHGDCENDPTDPSHNKMNEETVPLTLEYKYK